MIIDWSGQHQYIDHYYAYTYNPYSIGEIAQVPAVLLYDGRIHGIQNPNVNQPGNPQYAWFGVNPENLNLGTKPDIHDANWISDGDDHQDTPAILGAYNVIEGVNKKGSSPTMIKKHSKPEITKK